MSHIQDLPIPVRVFLETARTWIDAIDRAGLADANAQSEMLKAHGELLVADPEFRRLFIENRAYCADDDPQTALNCMYAFFKAVNDAALSGRYRAGKHILSPRRI